MSGELKNPSYNIPVGTLTAIAFTSFIYILLLFLVAATGTSMLRVTFISFWLPINYYITMNKNKVYTNKNNKNKKEKQ